MEPLNACFCSGTRVRMKTAEQLRRRQAADVFVEDYEPHGSIDVLLRYTGLRNAVRLWMWSAKSEAHSLDKRRQCKVASNQANQASPCGGNQPNLSFAIALNMSIVARSLSRIASRRSRPAASRSSRLADTLSAYLFFAASRFANLSQSQS